MPTKYLMSSVSGNQALDTSASCGIAAVLTAGSKPIQSPSERTKVAVVVSSAVQRTALAPRTNSVTSAPTSGRKMTIEVR